MKGELSLYPSMATTSDNEPTLKDLANKLDRLSSHVEVLSSNVETLSNGVEALSNDVEALSNDFEALSSDAKKFDEQFADYRQATQWVVQLAFTLIVSATITVIITSVL
jgi:outer membrane murein-binding lipoprotein Lpp